MEKLEQIIDLLKGLSDDEVDKIKSILKTDAEAETTEEVKEPVDLVEDKQEDNQTEVVDSEESTETAQEEQEKVEDKPVDDESEETQTEELVNLNTEQLDSPQAETEEIPKMQRGEQVVDEDKVETPQEEMEDNQEDFKQIIEAQNAKIAALEAENATLKSKVDGAFGYSSKVSMPTKTNRLYDDCSDVHIHR